MLSNTTPTRHGRSCATATVASICPGDSLRRSTLIRRVGFSLARAISRARSSVFGVAPSRSAGSARRIRAASSVGRAVDRDLAQPRLDHRDPHRARGHLLLGQEDPDRAVAGAHVGELQGRDRRLQVGERARAADVLGQRGVDLHRIEQGVALDAEALHLEGRRGRGPGPAASGAGDSASSGRQRRAAAPAGASRPRAAARRPAGRRRCCSSAEGQAGPRCRRPVAPPGRLGQPTQSALVLGRRPAIAAARCRRVAGAAIEQARVARRQRRVERRRRRRGAAPAARSACR